MKKVFTLLLFILLILAVYGCSADEEEINYTIGMNTEFKEGSGLSAGNGEKVKVVLLLGQSNASGCSIVEYLQLTSDEDSFAKYQKGFENVLINYSIDDQGFSSNGAFVTVDLNCGCGKGFFGPEVGMAEMITEQSDGTPVMILKFTMSGYSLADHWLAKNERGEIYGACMDFVHKYMQYISDCNYSPSLEAICWMQGESDTSEERAARYYDNQMAFMRYLREDLDVYCDGEIYFIDAGISSSPYCEPGYPTVNDAKKRISEQSEYNIYFSTIDEGLTTLYEPDYAPDLGHYDAKCEIKLGQLFGERIVKVIFGDR